jgi:aminobenzoyl-glutamate utilization protein B
VSWNVPTVTLRYPCNISGLPGHHWANAITMATPIAHKGATAGAKAMALTILDLLTNPELVNKAWAYFHDVQEKDIKYASLLASSDAPAVYLNRTVMERFRPALRKLYFDPSRYKTYLEQLGIAYPTAKKP